MCAWKFCSLNISSKTFFAVKSKDFYLKFFWIYKSNTFWKDANCDLVVCLYELGKKYLSSNFLLEEKDSFNDRCCQNWFFCRCSQMVAVEPEEREKKMQHFFQFQSKNIETYYIQLIHKSHMLEKPFLYIDSDNIY